MNQSVPQKRYKTLIIFTLSVFFCMLLLATFMGFWGLKPLLTKRIQAAVLESTNGLYAIDFNGLQYDVIAGKAEVSGVVWQSDTTIFDGLRANNRLPDNIYEAKVNKIELTGLRPWTIIFSKKLHLNSIVINSPIIDVLHQKQPYNSLKTAKSPYQIISKFVKSFEVEKVSFDNITFNYTNLSNPQKPQRSKVENLDLVVSNFLIDSTSHTDKQRFYYTKECIFKLKKVEISSKDSLNVFAINTLVFSTKSRSLNIGDLRYQPRYQPIIYGNKSNGEDRILVSCKNLELTGISLQKLFFEKKLYADNLQIDSGFIHVFTDTRPFKTLPKANFRPFPPKSFKNLAFKMCIDTVTLKQFNITYSEYNPETKLVGNVKFRQVEGNIFHCTNDTIPLAQNSNCIFSLKAKLMNKADIFLTFNFDLNTPNEDFLCKGRVVKMQANAVNQVLKSLVMSEIKTGYIKEFSFDLKGNKFKIKGSAKMLYNDLDVMIYRQLEKTGAFKKRKFLSFIANSFMIKNSNPIRNKPVRIAKIDYKRVPNKAFFYTIWKSLVVGIYGSVI
jgi:hypothetical protein